MSHNYADFDAVANRLGLEEQSSGRAGDQKEVWSETNSTGNPLVTVAVPTLNGADYIRETLVSVLAQDYPNLEILISDNGSRDNTPDLVQESIKNERRARFRRNTATVPQHEHFTQCVEAARGEFFVLLCDDDHINSRFVSELVAVALRYRDVNVVLPTNVTIDENGGALEKFAQPENDVFDGPEFVCQWLHGRGPRLFINVVTVLYRTNIVRQFGGYKGLAGGRNNDNLLFLQCAIMGRVGFAHRAEFSWRVYDQSYGSLATPREICESSREFLGHLKRNANAVRTLRALPATRQKQILAGVRNMSAVELVYQIKFLRSSVLRETFSRNIPLYRWDSRFCLVVLRHYYRRLRQLFHSVR